MSSFYNSEQNYRRFEPAFQSVVNSYPTPVKVRRGNLRLTTCTARCRDAMKSLEVNRWTSTFDIDKFLTLRPFLCVRTFDEYHIVIEPKENRQRKLTANPITALVIATDKDLCIDDKDFFALARLIHKGIINGPVSVVLSESIPYTEQQLQQNFPNVEFIDHGNNQYVLC